MSGEGAILLFLQNQVRNPVLDEFFIFFTQLGNGGLLFLAGALVLLCIPKTRRVGAVALLALAIGALCTNVVLKHLVGRARPWLDVAGLIPLVAEHDPNSFPSGHTCGAFAFGGAVLFSVAARWKKVLALSLAALMGFSRLYVGVHYPSDVLVGLMIGLLAGYLAWNLAERMEKRRLS